MLPVLATGALKLISETACGPRRTADVELCPSWIPDAARVVSGKGDIIADQLAAKPGINLSFGTKKETNRSACCH